jgi:TRAP-type C4-dicarboxylate transport system substrate-binding protein
MKPGKEVVMERMIIVRIGMVIVLCWLWSGGATESTAEAIELKLAHFMPPVHVQHTKNFIPFAERVAKLSAGQVTVKIYPGGTLGDARQLYDATLNGVTDIAFFIPSYLTGRFPRSSVFELPALFDSGAHLARASYEVYDKYIADDFKDVKVLCMYGPGQGQLGFVNRNVRSVADMRGLKIRSPNAEMNIALRALGATPVGMPVSELAVSLQKGVVEGVLTPYSAFVDFKVYDLVKYVTEVNLYGTYMIMIMNKKSFASLPEIGKKAIEEASGKQWGLHVARVYDQADVEAAEQMKSTGKIQLSKMPDPEKAKISEMLKGMAAEWVETVSKKGIQGQAILDAVKAAANATR